MLWWSALGGALGSVARFLVGPMVQRMVHGPLPVGTLAINVVGSFLIGLVLRSSLQGGQLSSNTIAFLTVGFCGGLTTFSAFSWETLRLLEDGEVVHAFTYIALSVALSVTAVFLGSLVARGLIRS